MNPFFQLTLAVVVSILVIPLVRHFAPRLGLVDMPDPRKVHTVPIPRVGGWGITLGILVPLLLAFKLEPLLQSFLIGCLTLFAFGIWDDAREIGHWVKFLGQIAAVGVVVFYGGLWVSRVPFTDATLPAAIGEPFTMFAMIGVINAINHSDGLDGLAGGESILSLIALAVLGYMSGSGLILGVSLTAIGGIFGFLRYNSHPAYVFMGDCGSQVLGFTLAFLVVYLTQTANTAVSAALPLLILGVPVADIISVLCQRISGGMNWFKATRNHLHHRLLQLGFAHYETVVIIYSIHAALVLSAVVLRYQSDVTVCMVYVGAVATLFLVLTAAERGGWRIARGHDSEPRLTRAMARIRASKAFLYGPLLVITVTTPLVMLLSSVWAAEIPREFALGAAVLAMVLAMQLLWPRLVIPALLRIVIYATAIFPAYLLISYPGSPPHSIQAMVSAVMIVLVVAIVLHVRFNAQRFGTTPTDYLIACAAAALVVYSSIDTGAANVVEAVLLATVLMYACETILASAATGSSGRVLQFSTLGTLLIISLRGVL